MARYPIRIRMGGAEVARLRFAVSPVFETVLALDALREPGAHAVQLPWARWARPLIAEIPDAPLLAAFGKQTPKPAFLMPVPDVRMPSLDDELRRVRAHSVARVRAYYDRNFTSLTAAQQAMYDDPPAMLARLAGVVRAVHDAVIAPHWPRMLGVLEADIAHRVQILADRGTETVFAGLHPDVEWSDGAVLLHKGGRRDGSVEPKDVVLDGRGLVLSPSVFCWPNSWVATRPTNAGVLRYPARGIATLWESRRPAPDALAALLGRTRAELLVRLDAPAGTGELARDLGVTAGAVSQHLGVLRAAGLVATRRDGRAVLHLRTDRADALLR